jgi:endonuclease G
VLVVLPDGNRDLSRIGVETRVIAVSMPNLDNEDVQSAQWEQYVVNVAQVEKSTGYKLLSQLPPPVQGALKQKIDRGR